MDPLVTQVQRLRDFAQRASGAVQLAHRFVEREPGANGLPLELVCLVARLGGAPQEHLIDGHSCSLLSIDA
jgi:hypothetical protein